jgi:hypothetical protein
MAAAERLLAAVRLMTLLARNCRRVVVCMTGLLI